MRSHDVLCEVESQLLVASLNLQIDIPALCFLWQPLFPPQALGTSLTALFQFYKTEIDIFVVDSLSQRHEW